MLLEEGITPAGPDMIAGIDAQPRDVLLEVAKFNATFAKKGGNIYYRGLRLSWHDTTDIESFTLCHQLQARENQRLDGV